jgi:hypothetical protein
MSYFMDRKILDDLFNWSADTQIAHYALMN